MQEVSTQDLSNKLTSLLQRSDSIKVISPVGKKVKNEDVWFHGTYRQKKDLSKGKRSNSAPSDRVSTLWNLISPMDEEVRQTLNSSGLDKFVPQIASLGIETMVDLTNPFLVTDEQLRKIGMTTRHIERFRSHATPLPRVISCEEDVENVSLPEVEVRAPPVPSFVPLLSDLGLEEYEKPLRNLCRTESSRALLLKASEKDICGLGVPLVKARKLLDKIRSNEADALVEGTRYRAGRRVSGKSVDGILVDLGISHFQDNILATAGGLDVYDILRVTELELVERCGLPRLQARKLRRRVLQTTHENKGGPGSEDLSAPFDKSLRAATSFNEVQSVGRRSFGAQRSFLRSKSDYEHTQ